MRNFFSHFFSGRRLGIDLGTANSLVYLVGTGIVLNEPTVVAVATDDNRVVAVGNEAREMLGRTPGTIVASKPLRDGVIADYLITEAMLRYFLDKVCGPSRIRRPDVMICVPAGVTSVERRAVLDATLSAGARTAYLIDEPLAAAIGAKIPIAIASGNMIVDIGGGSTEAAVISLGGVVVHNSVRVGGNKIDEAITGYIRHRFNLLIGERMAEEIKITLANAFPSANTTSNVAGAGNKKSIAVRGRDTVEGLPRTITLSEQEVSEAIKATLAEIIKAIKGVLEQTPPELVSDIIDKGIVLSGGTSQLKNLDKLLTQETGVPCHVAENPMLCVVIGTGIAMESIDHYKRAIRKR